MAIKQEVNWAFAKDEFAFFQGYETERQNKWKLGKVICRHSRSRQYVMRHVGEPEYTLLPEQKLYKLDSLRNVLLGTEKIFREKDVMFENGAKKSFEKKDVIFEGGTKKSFEKKVVIFEGGNRVDYFYKADYEGWVNEVGWEQGNLGGQVEDQGLLTDDAVVDVHYSDWVKDCEGSFGDYGSVWNSRCYD